MTLELLLTGGPVQVGEIAVERGLRSARAKPDLRVAGATLAVGVAATDDRYDWTWHPRYRPEKCTAVRDGTATRRA
jgi:hypothetical protein